MNSDLTSNAVSDEHLPLREGSADPAEIPKRKEEYFVARWIVAWLGCLGFVVLYCLKVNLSVAIIAMVNHTATDSLTDPDPGRNHSHGCSYANSQQQPLEDGPFEWDENVQGIVLAAYFYGYITTQIAGGWLAEKFSAKNVFGIGTVCNAVFTLLLPWCATVSYGYLVALRIGMGITAGVTLPAMHSLLGQWAPPQERSQLASSTYVGMTLGTLLGIPLTGLLASTWGWQSVFYVEGGVSLIWYAFWHYFVYDSPQTHPRITKEEREYIQTSLSTNTAASADRKKLATPWKEIWTSRAVWAIIIAHTCTNWGWYMLLVKLPTYMHRILHFNLKSNALYSSLPYMCLWIFSVLFATLLDFLMKRKVMTTSYARKFATFTGMFVSGLCLVCVTFVGCDWTLAVFYLSFGTMVFGAGLSGFMANHLDIAPPFAGTLMGISNTFATIPGIIVPSIVGYMTNGNQTVEVWRQLFVTTFAIQTFGAIMYCLLASGEQQPWAKRQDPEEKKQLKNEE